MAEFDATSVKERALAALIKNSSDPEESRQIFLEEIMDWSDYFTEQFGESSSAAELDGEGNTASSKIFESIVDLWLEFAAFEISLRQFKKAVEVYEKAVSDPVVSSALRIHLSYADYCVDRGKLANARKVYLKAIQLPFSNADRSNLWNRFLILMHKINKSDELTIEQLFLAVKQQLIATVAAESASDVLTLVPPPNLTCVTDDTSSLYVAPTVTLSSAPNVADGYMGGSLPVDVTMSVEVSGHGNVSFAESKESLAEPADSFIEPSQMGDAAHMEVADSDKTAIEALDSSTSAVAVGDDLDSLTGLTPEMVVKMYNRRPPMIFTATNREPLISGLRCLDSKLTSELEDFIGCPLSSVVSSVGGERDTAIASSNSATVDAYLDLLESMWATQALKERHFDSWMAELHQMHSKEEAEIQRRFDDERKQKENISNDADYKRFVSRCSVQRELLNCIINKAMFALLMEQQIVLTQIGFPRFNMQLVEALHSFINGRKLGGVAGTLKQNNPQFEYEYTANILDQIAAQRKLVCGFLSLRMFAVNEDRSKLQAAANRMRISSRAGGKHELYSSDSKQHRQHPIAGRRASDSIPATSQRNALIPPLNCGDAMVVDDDGNNISPVSPASSDAGGFDSDAQSGDCMDYYSLEAKKRRRKRRLNVQHVPNEGVADQDNNGWTERNTHSNYNSMSTVLSGSAQHGSVYANRYNNDDSSSNRNSLRNSAGWGNSYNSSSSSSNSNNGWNDNRQPSQVGQFSEYDERNYQDFGGQSAQDPHQDALKLPLLHKLAVMLKQQTGGQQQQN